MDLNKLLVCDCETDGFLDVATKVHVFGVSWRDSQGQWKQKATGDYDDMRKLLSNPNNIIVIHNGYSFDKPVLEKILGIKVEAYIIDTLYVSWVLFPRRMKFSLESFGIDYGVEKPQIESWTDLTFEEYQHRVIEDVKINTLLWEDCLSYLMELYDQDVDKIIVWLKFVNFKAENVADQERYGIKLDIETCQKNIDILSALQTEIVDVLKTIMPQIPVVKTMAKPNKCFKVNKLLSEAGKKWFAILEENNIDLSFNGVLQITTGHNEPNPNSVDQVKEFLFSKGWVPQIFKETIVKSGEKNLVPQLRDKDKNLCKSILHLAEDFPELKYLEKLSVISSRLGVVKGFMKNVASNGYIKAQCGGLAASLRLKHKTLVNLPRPSSDYGEYIRSLLVCEEDEFLLGTDLSSLENYTRTHFIAPIQPEAVEILKDPEYDSHTQLAIFAGMMTEPGEVFFKWYKLKEDDPRKTEDLVPLEYRAFSGTEREGEYHRLNGIRYKAKTTSYSALYGIGKAKLSKELKISVGEAAQLLEGYWKLNYAVREFALTCKRKVLRDQEWVLNPLNNFWYVLRSEKDIFSVVNQSAGDYCFTVYLKNIKKEYDVVVANFHDEALLRGKKGQEELLVSVIQKAIARTNKQIKMNVTLGMDYAIGSNYSEVH